MKTSEIRIRVDLDDNNVPERIRWEADDRPGVNETTAFALSVWEPKDGAIMKLDLWSKDMMVTDMKKFYVSMLFEMANTIVQATGDQEFATELQTTGERLAQAVVKEMKAQGQLK